MFATAPEALMRTISVAGAVLTVAELYAAASALADRLRGCPVAAVDATASLETIVAVLAGLHAGVPIVPVPPDSGPGERAHMLRDSQARLLLGQPDRLRELAASGQLGHAGEHSSYPVVGEPIETLAVTLSERAWSAPAAVADEASALIMYTSGTTGLPKGVQIPRRAIAACLDGLADAWAWTSDDVLVHGLPLFHVHGLVLGVLGPLRVGGSLIHTGRPSPQAYAAARAHGGTMFFGVPTVWSRIAADRSAARALAGSRLLVSGSAGLPRPVALALSELTGQVPVERYGMTETLITIAARADAPRRVGWVGTPIAGVSARVVDDAGELVAADGESVGDLQIRGGTTFTGYLGLPEVSAASWTADGWFRTGDVAAVDGDGWVRIVGRRSVDLIKSGGYRIGAGEIEAALLDHPGVSEAAVIGVPDDDLGQRIVAYVVRAGSGAGSAEALGSMDAAVSAAELTAHVGDVLSAHKRPREIRFVAALPRNEMGKVLKSALQ